MHKTGKTVRRQSVCEWKDRLDTQAVGISLECPSAARSRSFETYHAEDCLLDTAAFGVRKEEDRQELTVVLSVQGVIPTYQSQSDHT